MLGYVTGDGLGGRPKANCSSIKMGYTYYEVGKGFSAKFSRPM
jgi:hypothetical protein